MIAEHYQAAIAANALEADAGQQAVVRVLDELQRTLVDDEHRRRSFWRRLSPNTAPGPAGVYLWGGVGRGKTMLMDLFFETLAIEKKRRMHFHRMLRDVHERLAALDDTEDPLAHVANQLADEVRCLCFDEFYVNDIGDAMILGRLLENLFSRGVTLIATSNTRPKDLYRDGLQRQQFLPAIKAIEENTRVIELIGDTDYRLQLLAGTGTYLTPHDQSAEEQLNRYFEGSAFGRCTSLDALSVHGRDIPTVRAAKGVVWFDFADICDGPRSQEDYIELARWYPTVIVSSVPVLDRDSEDQARRFIALVDEFYDRKVKLVLSAERDIDTLYQGERLAFEFGRTASRLKEMQSDEYLHAAHLG